MELFSGPGGLADLESGITHSGFQAAPSLDLQLVSRNQILDALPDQIRQGRPPPRGDYSSFDNQLLVECQRKVLFCSHASHNT